MADFAASLGIDWADRKHDLCLIDSTTGKKEYFVIQHTPEAINECVSALRARFNGQQLAVSLEQSRGPLLFALLKDDCLVLYPVHPSTLARYREAFSPSRAKDDPTDAEYLAELLTTHRTASRHGDPMMSRPGRCNTWSNTAGGLSQTARASASG